jgi:type I restriction enzyme M protein
MDINDYQKQTNTNIQEKANLIWEIATHLYGEYKPHEYGRVILPMTVIKRFDDALKDTKAEVVATANQLDERKVEGLAREAILKQVAKHDFYNTSKFDFPSLLSDSDNIAANFTAYLQGFSDNVKDIIARFEFDKEIQKMSENDLLFTIITEFNSKKADMSPDHVTSQDMGYIFEELIRKFSESYDEQAGAHFTARDIIYLMTDLLIAPERDQIKANGCAKTAYDMAMGTSQMLACLDERLKAVNAAASLKCFGQEFNLVAHVDRPAELGQRTLNDFDGSVHARAKTPGLGEEYLAPTLPHCMWVASALRSHAHRSARAGLPAGG